MGTYVLKLKRNSLVTQGWVAHSRFERGGAMTVFEALMLAIAFTTLVLLILSFNHKK